VGYVTSLDDEPADGVAGGRESTAGRVAEAHPSLWDSMVCRWRAECHFQVSQSGNWCERQEWREACARGAIREFCGRDPTVWHSRVCPSGEAWSKIDEIVLCTTPTIPYDTSRFVQHRASRTIVAFLLPRIRLHSPRRTVTRSWRIRSKLLYKSLTIDRRVFKTT
jgi:hypothetical protein